MIDIRNSPPDVNSRLNHTDTATSKTEYLLKVHWQVSDELRHCVEMPPALVTQNSGRGGGGASVAHFISLCVVIATSALTMPLANASASTGSCRPCWIAVRENPSDGRLVAEVQHSSDDVSPLDIVRAAYYREYEVGEGCATLATPHLRLGWVPGSSRFLFTTPWLE
jgi:hypothetical protein